jgi:hypothetical protein
MRSLSLFYDRDRRASSTHYDCTMVFTDPQIGAACKRRARIIFCRPAGHALLAESAWVGAVLMHR